MSMSTGYECTHIYIEDMRTNKVNVVISGVPQGSVLGMITAVWVPHRHMLLIRVSKRVTESIRNIARGVGIN